MTKLSAWILNREDDETFTLFAPNGVRLFNVSLPTLAMLGRMFLDAEEDAEELEDLREVLYD